MLLVYLLSMLGLLDRKHTHVRPGVWKFALFVLGTLSLFIVVVLVLAWLQGAL